MKKLTVLVVLAMLFLSACNAVKVVVPDSTQTATVQSSTPDLSATVQAAVNATLTAEEQIPEAATSVVEATSVSTEVVSVKDGQADVRTVIGSVKNSNGWTGMFYEGATDQIKSWMSGLKVPDKNWPEPPNADSPSHSFVKANGMYWPNGESHYGQWGSKADLNVPALHVRVYTGDFELSGIGECRKVAETDPGCALIIVNVGDMTAMFRDGMYDYGWTTTGPYFNGDEMISTLWAVSSHVSHNMLNVAGGTNLGANCSVAEGCPGVHITLAIISGNQVLSVVQTTVH